MKSLPPEVYILVDQLATTLVADAEIQGIIIKVFEKVYTLGHHDGERCMLNQIPAMVDKALSGAMENVFGPRPTVGDVARTEEIGE